MQILTSFGVDGRRQWIFKALLCRGNRSVSVEWVIWKRTHAAVIDAPLIYFSWSLAKLPLHITYSNIIQFHWNDRYRFVWVKWSKNTYGQTEWMLCRANIHSSNYDYYRRRVKADALDTQNKALEYMSFFFFLIGVDRWMVAIFLRYLLARVSRLQYANSGACICLPFRSLEIYRNTANSPLT